MPIDLLCLVGSFAAGIVLLYAWLRHAHWWLAALGFGVLCTGVNILLSLAVDQIGRQGVIDYGMNPTAVLRVMLLLSIGAVVMQMIGMIGCSVHFMRRAQR